MACKLFNIFINLVQILYIFSILYILGGFNIVFQELEISDV